MTNLKNDNDETTPLELFDLELPDVDKERRSNDDFMRDLVQASNEVSKTIILTSGVIPQKEISAEKLDVLAGHLARLFKLYDSYIFLIVNRRAEIAFILLRTIAETIINLSYLLKHLDTDVYKKYKRASLAYEKKAESKILDNISARGYRMPIEERMLKSIGSTYERSGLQDLEEDEFEKTEWGLTKEHLKVSGKAKEVGLYEFYEHVFRGSSHFIHGSWHDLDFNHLEKDLNSRGTRSPDMTYRNPIPQFMETTPIFILKVLQEYVAKIVEVNDDAERIQNHMNEISEWFFEMSQKHETFLASNK